MQDTILVVFWIIGCLVASVGALSSFLLQSNLPNLQLQPPLVSNHLAWGTANQNTKIFPVKAL